MYIIVNGCNDWDRLEFTKDLFIEAKLGDVNTNGDLSVVAICMII